MKAAIATLNGNVTSAIPAGELHIGEIGSNQIRVDVAQTVTASSAYTSGNAIGGLMTIANAVRISGSLGSAGTGGILQKEATKLGLGTVEATATIAACLTAWRADGDVEWKAIATRVFDWFLGSNDLSVALVDPHTGSCRDGLHPDRANENRGGESVLSYLLSLAEIRQLARANAGLTKPAALRAVGA